MFTHITDELSSWLLELHRVLAPSGVLVASFLGEGMSQTVAGEPWDAERIGMNVLDAHRRWEHGGPTVLLAPWWIREHWGRAFEIVHLDPGSAPNTHGLIVARPRPNPPSRAELERIDPADPREIAALQHNLRQLRRESARAAEALDEAVRGFEASRSWRLTAPLRRLGERMRAS